MSDGSALALVRRVWVELGRDERELDALTPLPEAPLPSRLDVSALAVGSVAAPSLASEVASRDRHAGRAPGRLRLDGDRIAAAFTSERGILVDGSPPDIWAPLSGFQRTRDGWVRTHGNYPHHAEVLRRVLGLPATASADEVAAAFLARGAEELSRAVEAAGGLCVVVRPEDPATDAAWRASPLIDLGADADDEPVVGRRRPEPSDPPPHAPLRGVRVLDLTRVIAGPVATRTLAVLGADVLRIDPPALPEPEWQHFDTGAGKRSTLLDLADARDRRRFDELAAAADVVVTGYRPAAMARLGLDPSALRARHPHLLVASLAAWGFDGADADRRGFDSLVQAETGIAVIEDDADRPGALPAQALDHATGYLLAAAVTSQLAGGGRRTGVVRMSLRRTAAELLGMPRTSERTPAEALGDAARSRHLRTFEVGGTQVQTTAPAVVDADGPLEWTTPPRRWAVDAATWSS